LVQGIDWGFGRCAIFIFTLPLIGHAIKKELRPLHPSKQSQGIAGKTVRVPIGIIASRHILYR